MHGWPFKKKKKVLTRPNLNTVNNWHREIPNAFLQSTQSDSGEPLAARACLCKANASVYREGWEGESWPLRWTAYGGCCCWGDGVRGWTEMGVPSWRSQATLHCRSDGPGWTSWEGDHVHTSAPAALLLLPALLLKVPALRMKWGSPRSSEGYGLWGWRWNGKQIKC
jgi:hypothetical protein